MRTIEKFFLLMILVSGECFARGAANEPPIQEKGAVLARVQPQIEVKLGYFFFASSIMRDVYDQGGVDVQLCGSYPMGGWIQIYGSVEFFEREGHSMGTDSKVWLTGVPLSLGLKPVFTITPEVLYYFTIGPRYSFIQTRTNYPYVKKHANSSGIGLFVNTGFDFILWKHFLLDLFGEYSYLPVSFSTAPTNVYGQRVQVSGFTFGGGLGYAF